VQKQALPNTDLGLTRVGVGTAPIGSGKDWPVFWGPQNANESIRAIQRALDLGVNWIDTAPFYGWGRAEEIVGESLQGRDDVLIFTKCGTFPDAARGDRMDLSRLAVRADIEASLRRLRREHVDLLQIHDVDRQTPIEETWGEMQRLIEEGKVRYGGISNHPVDLVERALAVGPVAALQYEYSLLTRRHEDDILPLAEARNVGVLTWSPLAAGFVSDGFELDVLDSDDFRHRHPFASLDLTDLRKTLRSIGERHGRTSAQVAVAWVLRQPAVAGAIVGVRSVPEAEQLPGAAELRLTADELREIDSAIP
jgi:aryl-alcohol dehydrogenase-like predicted oxidoreductase